MTPDPERIKVAKVLLVEKEILGVDEMVVEEDVVVVVEGHKKQTLQNHSEEPTGQVQHGPEFSFSVQQLTGHVRQSSYLITLIVGVNVAVSDVLIDSGATCNVVGNRPEDNMHGCFPLCQRGRSQIIENTRGKSNNISRLNRADR